MLWSNLFGAAIVLMITIGTAELPAALAFFAASRHVAALLTVRSLSFYVRATPSAMRTVLRSSSIPPTPHRQHRHLPQVPRRVHPYVRVKPPRAA